MARSRNIKPGLAANAELAECSIWARYLFALLPTIADREGRLEDRPKQIKGELLRFDNEDVEPLLCELAARRFIIRYQNSGGRWIQITKFWKHQNPHYSEKKSAIEPPSLQEWPEHERPKTLGKSSDDEPENQENSGNSESLRGGQNPLIPDSLNLIPDSLSVPPEKGVDRKPKPAKQKPGWWKGNHWAVREGQELGLVPSNGESLSDYANRVEAEKTRGQHAA